MPIFEPIIDFRLHSLSGFFSAKGMQVPQTVIVGQIVADVIVRDDRDCFGERGPLGPIPIDHLLQDFPAMVIRTIGKMPKQCGF